MVAITQDAQQLQTQATIEGIATRLFWKRDAAATIKAIEDQAAAEARDRRRDDLREIMQFRTAQVDAANAAFSGIETFAGIAQTAVEDSYFGQTKAGRKAAKAMFIAGKAAALGSAIVNTAQAVSAAAASAAPPFNVPAIVAAGITGAASIGTIVATTIQGLADAGLPPGALRAAGLNNHTAFAIRNDEMVLDPKGTSEISRMMELQRRQMEMGAMGGANTAPVSVQLNLDGRRVTEGLAPHMTERLEDGHDFRRNVRMSGVA
jgi:hypothetical protein